MIQHAHKHVSLKTHDHIILCRASVHHLPFYRYILIGAPAVTHGAGREVMCRPESPDFGAARHGIPLERSMWQQAPQQRAEQRQGALAGMHPDECQHRSVLYHQSPCTLQTRTSRSPGPPCRDRIARSAGCPRRVSHRAAPTASWSSTTERAHSTDLHDPTCTHACQAQVT
jgi:hypothetical protein